MLSYRDIMHFDLDLVHHDLILSPLDLSFVFLITIGCFNGEDKHDTHKKRRVKAIVRHVTQEQHLMCPESHSAGTMCKTHFHCMIYNWHGKFPFSVDWK